MNGTITIYRGSHQIGGCVTEIKYGANRILIDFGANLPGSEKNAVMSDEELVNCVFAPEMGKCDAVLFTHYHGDHYGLYKKIPQNVHKYIGSTAKKILEIITERIDTIQEEKGLSIVRQFKTYRIGKWKSFGDIKIMPLVVDHSALDAYMFVIQLGEKKILFTGDFRDHGIVGSQGTFEKMIEEYVGKVDILITEGTMISRIKEAKENPVQTEEELGVAAGKFFEGNHETVILVSSTNLDSIMEFYHAIPKDKAFVCDAYQAKIILTAIADKGKYYPKYRLADIHGITRNFYIVGDMQGLGREQNCYQADFTILRKKGFVMLARPNRIPDREKGRFEKIVDKLDDPLIIYSMWKGYREEKHADPQIIKFLEGHRVESLHTSGHAYVETIKKLIQMTEPELIIPMHTECAEEFKEVPEFKTFAKKVKVLQDNIPFQLEGN